jgi:hypothetical protein
MKQTLENTEDLRSLLRVGIYKEQKLFLRSFTKRIDHKSEVSINYTISVPLEKGRLILRKFYLGNLMVGQS